MNRNNKFCLLLYQSNLSGQKYNPVNPVYPVILSFLLPFEWLPFNYLFYQQVIIKNMYPLKNWGWFCPSEFSVPFDKSSGQVLLNEKSKDNWCRMVREILRFAQNASVTLFYPQFLSGYKNIFVYKISIEFGMFFLCCLINLIKSIN
jgi:hypothetical protein